MSGKEREGGKRRSEKDTEKDGEKELIFIFAWRHGRVEVEEGRMAEVDADIIIITIKMK